MARQFSVELFHDDTGKAPPGRCSFGRIRPADTVRTGILKWNLSTKKVGRDQSAINAGKSN